MSKYQKKPCIIEAKQITKENLDSILDWINGHKNGTAFISDGHINIQTLEGIMAAEQGDFIINGIKGEFYPCKPDIFLESYLPVKQ